MHHFKGVYLLPELSPPMIDKYVPQVSDHQLPLIDAASVTGE